MTAGKEKGELVHWLPPRGASAVARLLLTRLSLVLVEQASELPVVFHYTAD